MAAIYYPKTNWQQFRTVCLLCGAYVTPDDNGDILHACNGRGVDILPKPLDASEVEK